MQQRYFCCQWFTDMRSGLVRHVQADTNRNKVYAWIRKQANFYFLHIILTISHPFTRFRCHLWSINRHVHQLSFLSTTNWEEAIVRILHGILRNTTINSEYPVSGLSSECVTSRIWSSSVNHWTITSRIYTPSTVNCFGIGSKYL
jgi:hypothetical protein